MQQRDACRRQLTAPLPARTCTVKPGTCARQPPPQVDDFGFDGVDVDFEPPRPRCQITSGQPCKAAADLANAVKALRKAMPAGAYLMSLASFHVGCYGEGAFAASLPITEYTGLSLALARSDAGKSLDLINIMACVAARGGWGWGWGGGVVRVHPGEAAGRGKVACIQHSTQAPHLHTSLPPTPHSRCLPWCCCVPHIPPHQV